MKFLNMFIEDCKYYDKKEKELSTIKKYVNLKDKTLLDIGTGIGRLAFPLAKYAKEVVAIDKDKRLKLYFDKHKSKNLAFVNKPLEEYAKKAVKYDIILIAWPTINFHYIKMIKRLMHKNSLLIFITADTSSNFETIPIKLSRNIENYKKDIENKKQFIKKIMKEFFIVKRKRIITDYTYQNKKIALRSIKNNLALWFNINIDKNKETLLNGIIDKHTKNKKVVFKEDLLFYLLRLKNNHYYRYNNLHKGYKLA